MGTRFVITAKQTADVYTDHVAVGDAISYALDATPWQEDNATITTAVWALESGSAVIGTPALSSGVASALITFNTEDKVIVSVTFTAGTMKKKVWLNISAVDPKNMYSGLDYE